MTGDMGITVRLEGGGGSGGGSKTSAKLSYRRNVVRQQASNNFNFRKTSRNVTQGISLGASFLSGSEGALASAFTKVPGMGYVYGLAKSAERTLSFFSQYREARSGESMLESNYRAKLKTNVALGSNILAGRIRNQLFTNATIIRQNMALNYNRELYNYNAYGSKFWGARY